MAEYYNQKSLMTGAVPQMDVGALLKAGQSIGSALGGVSDRELAASEVANKRKQQEFSNTLALAAEERAKRAEAERVNDKEASKLFNTVLAEGPQVSGGILNQPQLIAESDKYSMTPEEQKLAETYKVGGLYSGDAARKAGNTVLADKLDWQNKMSGYADRVHATGIGNESEVGLLKRAMKSVANKGLAPTDAMTLAIREAQLAEKEAQTAAEEKYTKSLDSDTKEWFSNLLTAGSANDSMLKRASGGSGIDLETGEAYGGGLALTSKNGLNETTKAYDAMRKSILDLELPTEDKNTLLVKGTSDFINKLKSGNTPVDAAATVAGSVGVKEPLLFGDNTGYFKQNTSDLLANQAKRVTDMFGNQGGATSTSGAGGILSSEKAQVAESIANYYKNKRASAADKLSLLDMTPEERRNSAILKGAREFGLLGDLTKEGTGADTAKGTGLTSSGKAPKYVASLSAGIEGVPNSLVQSEAVTTEAYKDGKGYSIAMGYNLAANDKDIDNDFANAGISKEKAYIARTNPGKLVLTDDEAKRLSQVSTYKYMDQLDGNLKNWGVKGGFDSLSPQMQAIALQMRYRGDLSTSTEYGKDLINFVKNDDVKGIQNYVIENKDTLPAPVVARMQHNITFPETSPLRGTMTDAQKNEYLANSTNSGVVKKLFDNVKVDENTDTKILSRVSTTTEKDLKDTKWYNILDRAKIKTDLVNKGSSPQEAADTISSILKDQKEKERSDRLIADRNYLNAKKLGKEFGGKTAEEWDYIRKNGYKGVDKPDTQSSAAVNIIRKLNEGLPISVDEQSWVNSTLSNQSGAGLLKSMGLNDSAANAQILNQREAAKAALEAANIDAARKARILAAFEKDPASILREDIPQEIKDRYRMLQGAKNSGLLLK